MSFELVKGLEQSQGRIPPPQSLIGPPSDSDTFRILMEAAPRPESIHPESETPNEPNPADHGYRQVERYCGEAKR